MNSDPNVPRIRVLTQEDALKMDCPFPPEPEYMTEDVKLKNTKECREPKKQTLPKGVRMIKLDDDRIVLMRFFMGRWTQLEPEEEKRLIDLCH